MSATPDSPQRNPRPAYPSDLARSARRRAQRAALRSGRQQEAHEIALKLEELARGHSDYADLLNGLALRVRTRGNSSPDRDADSIMSAVSAKLPARTIGEIASETGLLKMDVKKTLMAMLATGIIREVRRPGAAAEYWPTGRQCGDVLP